MAEQKERSYDSPPRCSSSENLTSHAKVYAHQLTKKWDTAGDGPILMTEAAIKSTSSRSHPHPMTAEDARDFVKNHFSIGKQNDGSWTFACNCRYVVNCSMRRFDPQVKKALIQAQIAASPAMEEDQETKD